MTEIDIFELSAYIGLMLYIGLTCQSKLYVGYLFQDNFENPVFGATMSRNRFRYIHSKITFEDPFINDPKWKSDRFSAFRNVFEKFNYHCCEYLVPDDLIAIDETLYPIRTQH